MTDPSYSAEEINYLYLILKDTNEVDTYSLHKLFNGYFSCDEKERYRAIDYYPIQSTDAMLRETLKKPFSLDVARLPGYTTLYFSVSYHAISKSMYVIPLTKAPLLLEESLLRHIARWRLQIDH